MNDQQRSVHDRVGGLPAFVELVERFYAGVEADPVLRPVYPPDLEPGKQALAEFFSQYWGGPPVYSQKKGHPMLRRRHFPFRVTPQGADRWIGHMSDAVRAMQWPADIEEAMLDYVVRFAPTMVNADDALPGSLPFA